MAWSENFGFFLGPLNPFEDPDCGCCDEARAIPDEDAAYQEARDDRAGFNDWGDE